MSSRLRRQALTCTVAFQADMSTYQRTAASEVSPSFSSKSSGGFRSRLFGSPKKQRPVSTPVMPVDPFLSYVSPEGMLAKAVIDFEQCRPHCIGRRSKFSFPLVSPSNGMQIGTLDTHMFYLPPLSPLSSQLWPKSMHECEDGVRLLQKFGTEQRVLLKGELSQIGADCKVSLSSIGV